MDLWPKKMYSQKLVISRKCVRKVRFIRIRILPAVVNCTLNSCVVYAKASQSSVPSPQSNGEENVILFDYITATFFLD